jgi:hypothetical protein
MDLPSSNIDHQKATETPTSHSDENQLQTVIPLLSEVVVPGAALAEPVKTVAADARSTPADDDRGAEQQLMERLLPTLGKLVEVSVREVLSEASQQIVRNVLTQLHHQISAMPQERTATPIQQSPAKS